MSIATHQTNLLLEIITEIIVNIKKYSMYKYPLKIKIN